MRVESCFRRGYCRKHYIFAVADGGFAYAHSVFPCKFVAYGQFAPGCLFQVIPA